MSRSNTRHRRAQWNGGLAGLLARRVRRARDNG
ncbi:50S ribosomal protein L32, partial [Streptomyces sp. SID7982]|nr:50S ribosomal protein L32 [Streptomyces sp. SID7982]